MPRFLNTPERRTCRYDSRHTSEEVAGLYTDNFSECNIVILYKKDDSGTRISMTHADRLVRPDQIQVELDWIGEGAIAVVIAKNTPASEEIRRRSLGDLAKKFEVRYCEPTDFAMSFDVEGALKFYPRENLPPLVTHPQEWQWQSIFILNFLFATYEPIFSHRMRSPLEYAPPNYSVLKNTSLIFDGGVWQPLLKDDQVLNPLATEFMTYLQVKIAEQKSVSKSLMLTALQEFLQKKGVLAAVHQTDQILMLTHGLLIVTQNNYQRLFNDELRYILRMMIQQRVARPELDFLCLLIKETQDNFEKFSEFIDRVTPLKTPRLASCLMGIYKLCIRFKQHDAGVADLAQPKREMAFVAPA